MNQGRYVFMQLVDFLPRKNFEWLVKSMKATNILRDLKGKKKKDPKAYPLGSLLFSAPIGGILFRQLRVGSYRNPVEDE